MKLISHEKAPKPQTMELTTEPMVIFLTKTLEMHIERGDTVKQVALVVSEHWGLDRNEARRITGFWFALGERRASLGSGAPWSNKELSSAPDRQYLPKRQRPKR